MIISQVKGWNEYRSVTAHCFTHRIVNLHEREIISSCQEQDWFRYLGYFVWVLVVLVSIHTTLILIYIGLSVYCCTLCQMTW